MFNFLVTGMEITVPRGSLTLPLDRVFLHTDEDIAARFSPNGVLDETALMTLSTIFTNESSNYAESSVIARIGKIIKIRKGSIDYQIEYELYSDIPPIPNAVLETLATKLHLVIGTRFFDDFHTNHWSVKNVDLFQVLFTENIGRIKPRVFKLTDKPIDTNLVTVMMPFDAKFDNIFSALQDAAGASKMHCLRADDIWENDVIIQDVVKLISTARVVICDLTGKNSNVFYETGIAHTLGQDVILIAQHESDIPFDLRHIRHIKYLANEQGLKELTKNVSSRLQSLITK